MSTSKDKGGNKDFSYDVELDDNSDEAKDELKKKIERALYAIGVTAVDGAVTAISGGYTKENQAVDTGRLRASISFITAGGRKGSAVEISANAKIGDKLSGKAEPRSVIIGSNVEYAEYVHNGTSRMAGRPFLREGIDQKREEIEAIIRSVMEDK